jgi:hypothetical protein
MRNRWTRLAPLTGLVFVVLTVIGIFASHSTPNSDASGARVIAFYEAHHSAQSANDIVLTFAFIFFLFFAGSLRAYLRRTPVVEALAALVLAGAVLMTVGFTLFNGIDFSLADVPSKLSPSAAQALNLLDNDLFMPVFAGACVFGISSGLAILRGARLPKWLGWVAIVIGIASASPAFFFALIALLVWTVVVSILIYTRSGTATQPPVAGPAGAAVAASG